MENGRRIDELVGKKADRIELCDNLAVGGTTVSYGVAENVIRRCHAAVSPIPPAVAPNLPEPAPGLPVRVMAMIRPRGGDFVYSPDEKAMMLRDIGVLRDLGTDGVVFGCLGPDGGLDKKTAAELIARAAGLDITFHMAFDHINPDEQLDALNWLSCNGVTRILTHGSADPKTSILDNRQRLLQYVEAAASLPENRRIIILPGGGVTKDNVREVCAVLGVNEAHGTRLL
ncbi:MAG: copper homeostasis protein CutC [Treponema sp.]|nr:copper homeostasis protein CutC [Treponema sp.]